jgi:ssDNA-binding replication factor A large subunit
MKLRIRDLKPHTENVQVVARVMSKSVPAEVRMKNYAYAVVEDETGRIKLNLWREQVDQVDEGDLIYVSNAFVHVRMGEMQLSTWSDIKKASLKDFT